MRKPGNRYRWATPCRWLREHNGSVRPSYQRRLVKGTTVYSVLSNGQIMLERVAKKLGLVGNSQVLPGSEA